MKTNLHDLRVGKGLSLRDLGKMVGVTAQTLCSIEAETSTPSMGLLVSLSKALGVTPDAIIWDGIHDDQDNERKSVSEVTEIRCAECKESIVKIIDYNRIMVKCHSCQTPMLCNLERGSSCNVGF